MAKFHADEQSSDPFISPREGLGEASGHKTFQNFLKI